MVFPSFIFYLFFIHFNVNFSLIGSYVLYVYYSIISIVLHIALRCTNEVNPTRLHVSIQKITTLNNNKFMEFHILNTDSDKTNFFEGLTKKEKNKTPNIQRRFQWGFMKPIFKDL